MTAAVVYSFGVAPGLQPVVGAPSFGVLSRQIPRLVVGAMNGSGDRGLRFFPLLGPVEGKRQFFNIPELLAPEQLRELYGKNGVTQFLVDGRVEQSAVRVRIHAADSLREIFDETLPLDPCNPLPVATRLMYELSGALSWTGGLPKLPAVEPPVLSYFLVAKDDLLSLEAGFEREGGGHWLTAVETIAEDGLSTAEEQRLVLEIGRLLTQREDARERVVALLLKAASKVDDASFLGEAAMILQGAGATAEAGALLDRLVGREITSESIVLRLAGHLFHAGRHTEGLEQLEMVVRSGQASPRLRTQLMVFCQRLGKSERREELARELAEEPSLPASVARVVCTELLELELVDAAIAVGRRASDQHPKEPGVWLELGRSLLHGGQGDAAREALATAHSVASEGEGGRLFLAEIERLQRFVDDPQVMRDLSALDVALAAGDLTEGARLARDLTRQRPDLAEGWLFLGIVRQRADQVDPALEAFREAIAVDATLAEAHNRLGILLVSQSQAQDGYDHLREAVRLQPSESGPWVHLAQACACLGKLEEGREALERAAKLGASAETVAMVRDAFFAESR